MADMDIKTTIEMNTTTPSAQADMGAGTGAGNAGGDIIDISTQSFMADVSEASREKLVLVEFGAAWCEPCKQLEPVLEKIIHEARGQVRLAKMDIDAHPQIAQQLQVQSIPAVFAFKDGQPRDGFMGVLPESEIKKFIAKNLDGTLEASPIDKMTEAGEAALQDKNYEQAIACFQTVLEAQAGHIPALAGLAQCYIATQAPDKAEAILAQIPENAQGGADDPALAAARAALALIHKADTLGDSNTLQAKLQTDPNDHQARFDLALALHAAGERAAAIDALLEIIRRNRNWQDDAARKQLLELFTAYGAEDDVTIDGRRRLSSLLFS